MPSLSADDNTVLTSELQRLFEFQDRPLSKDKLASFVGAVEKSDLPLAAILVAIREMALDESLNLIKLPAMFAIARKKVITASREITPCDHCSKTGAVTMLDDENRRYSFACSCKNGDRLRNQDIVTWEGFDIQMTRARRYRLEWSSQGRRIA